MKQQIIIVTDVEVPVTQLLNNEDFQVLKTEEDGTYVMIKKEVPVAEYN